MKIRELNYPFAIISVIDERVINNKYTLLDLSKFISKFTDVYKFEPVYKFNSVDKKVEYQELLLSQLNQLVEKAFVGIKSLDPSNYIYENGIYRTIVNSVYNKHKKYVCSAHQHMALYPNGSCYACYNLANNNYLITKSLLNEDLQILSENLRIIEEKLKIEKFPSEYKEIEFFGDHCPKDNNFESFAYNFKKTMVEKVLGELKSIQPGTPAHLSLINYIGYGVDKKYMKNVSI